MLSLTEENYLKAVLHLTRPAPLGIGTKDLAAQLDVRPATVNSMVGKLKQKELLHHEKYGKITLTPAGRTLALNVIRKHRLWETFLYEKLDFNWDEVHEVAEQLEHVRSPKLIERLDKFLAYPTFDPHGEPIPRPDGQMPQRSTRPLSELGPGSWGRVAAVNDDSGPFLRYLQHLDIGIGTEIEVLTRIDYDQSQEIRVSERVTTVSRKLAENLLMEDVGS